MIDRFRGIFPAIIAVFWGILLITGCGKDTSTGPGVFDVYGRMAYRPFTAGPPIAEFYLFHNGEPIPNATIMVNSIDIPAILSESGHYFKEMNFRIGDTLTYSINSDFGTEQGTVIIPDTVEILSPTAGASLYTGVSFSSLWRKGQFVDGYFAYLKHQTNQVAQVRESQIDTTAELPGQYILDLGIDTFWVETIKGSFYAEVAPNGKVLPKGVVGAAGNYRNVYVIFAPPLAFKEH
jgi:hypothetical protein